ncbi:MAG: T9SS type A sorting domain-containing protein [Bacteroidales bacterium]|nr:T9SS type A sorting domain-containing protein [Bacteroidales bacterium]
MKKNLLLVSLLFLAASAMAQNETIVVTTSKAVGEQLRFMLGAEEADRPDVWIDLNNNSTKDEGETVVTFSPRTMYTIGSQTVTIHGKVTALYCNGTAITSLDLTNDPLLKELNCGSNALTSLDVTKNPLITYMQFYTNQITSVDLSNNTAMTDLNCAQNKLTELVLPSSAPALINIACYSNSISGDNMTAFMNSLPTTTTGNKITIFDTAATTYPEANAATAADVAIATGKNWSVINKNLSVYTGINNITNSDLNILSKKGYLEFNVAQPGELVSIYNIAGKQVFQGQLNGTSVNVPLEKGIYLVRVNSKVFKEVVE